MSVLSWILVALVAALLAMPVGQLVWVPLTHFRFVLYYRSQGIEAPSLGVAGNLLYHWRALAANLTMAWWMVRAFGRNGLKQPADTVTGPPVLCVHGYLRNGTCMWGIRRALERRGRPTRAVSMGLPFRRVEGYAPKLEAVLRELVDAFPGEKIDAVAHSMGGIVLRLVLAGNPDLAAAVGRVVTLGSPHRGTAAVRGVSLAPEAHQLAIGSAFLASLPDFRDSAPEAELVTCAAELDFIVYPKSTSHPPGSRAVDFEDPSHPGLVTNREVIAFVAETLSAPSEG
ncbi:MAG: hypothetical protein GY719_33690 [bacterium]|nr:hypothetical protein [bacterium]